MGIKRRDFLLSGAAVVASTAVAAKGARAQDSGSKIGSDTLPLRIGMTDWNLGERGKTEKIELARRIGLDGVQVSILYPEDGSLHLRCPELQAAYRKVALDNGVQICSLAIGNLGPGGPFKNEPMGVLRVADAIEVARNIGTNDILLPMFRNRVPQDDAEFTRIINSFKELALIAEKHEVVVALETSMSAEEHLRIIDGVGSPWIGVYMDPYNCCYYGHDPLKDIPLLKDHIHQVHVKNGKSLMSQPSERKYEWPDVAELLYKVGYKGWYVLETSAPSGDLIVDTRKNIEYVRQNFRIPA
jgi:L-ribulose-5-phosphate 3-epimerase